MNSTSLWSARHLTQQKKKAPALLQVLFGEPEGTRTPNLLIRSQVLYPIKLQVQNVFALKAMQI